MITLSYMVNDEDINDTSLERWDSSFILNSGRIKDPIMELHDKVIVKLFDLSTKMIVGEAILQAVKVRKSKESERYNAKFKLIKKTMYETPYPIRDFQLSVGYTEEELG
jgi:hypothetical protein